MIGWVIYPFHVRHNGVDYNPGVPIEVDDVDKHLQRGAKCHKASAPAPDDELSTAEHSEAPRKTGRRKTAQ